MKKDATSGAKGNVLAEKINAYEERLKPYRYETRYAPTTSAQMLYKFCEGILCCIRVMSEQKDIYLGEKPIKNLYECSGSWVFGEKGAFCGSLWCFRSPLPPGQDEGAMRELLTIAGELLDDAEKTVSAIFHTPATLRFFAALRFLLCLFRHADVPVRKGGISALRVWLEVVEERLHDLSSEFGLFERVLFEHYRLRMRQDLPEFLHRYRSENDRLCERAVPVVDTDFPEALSDGADGEAGVLLSAATVAQYYRNRQRAVEKVLEEIRHGTPHGYGRSMRNLLNPDLSMIGASIQALAGCLCRLQGYSPAVHRALAAAQKEVRLLFDLVNEAFPIGQGNYPWHAVVDCVDGFFEFARNVADGEADTDAEPMMRGVAGYHDLLVEYADAVEKRAEEMSKTMRQPSDSKIRARLEAIHSQSDEIRSCIERLTAQAERITKRFREKNRRRNLKLSRRELKGVADIWIRYQYDTDSIPVEKGRKIGKDAVYRRKASELNKLGVRSEEDFAKAIGNARKQFPEWFPRKGKKRQSRKMPSSR